MRLALLGLDNELVDFAAAATAAGHRVVYAVDAGEFLQPLMAAAPGVIVSVDWEPLLIDNMIDLAVFGTGAAQANPTEEVRPADLRGEQLRRFVQEGIPVAVLPFACDLDQGYELEMYRREQNGSITTWLPDWNHAGYEWLQNLLHDPQTSLGEVQQVRWDVKFPDRSRPVILRQFLNDVAHVRRSLGPIETVLANSGKGETHYDPFAPKQTARELDQLTVHLGTRSQRMAIWSVAPSTSERSATITVVGSQGHATLLLTEPTAPWRVEIVIGDQREEFTFEPQPYPWLELLKPAGDSLPSWIDSCRDLEVVEAIDRSLLRGRTVAVHADETSEMESFKGVMASGGCLLLMLALLLFVVAMGIEGLRLPIRNWPIFRLWPLILLLLFLAFMGLQSLRALVRPAPEKDEDPAKTP